MNARVLRSRHYLAPEVFVLEVDGSAVTTGATATNAGLLAGQHVAKIRRDTTGDANLWIVTFEHAFGREPQVFYQPITLDCALREEANYPTYKELRFKSYLHSNLSTALTSCDFRILVYGNKEPGEHGI